MANKRKKVNEIFEIIFGFIFDVFFGLKFDLVRDRKEEIVEIVSDIYIINLEFKVIISKSDLWIGLEYSLEV